MYCPKCGKELTDDAKYCAGCGVYVGADNNNTAQQQMPIRKKKSATIWIFGGIILFVIIGFVIGGISVYGNTEHKYARQIKLAERYLDELDYEKAIVAYKAAIEIDPKGAEAYLGLAEVYSELAEYEEALKVLREGYERTKDERIAKKIAELESKSTDIVTEEAPNGSDEVASIQDESLWKESYKNVIEDYFANMDAEETEFESIDANFYVCHIQNSEIPSVYCDWESKHDDVIWYIYNGKIYMHSEKGNMLYSLYGNRVMMICGSGDGSSEIIYDFPEYTELGEITIRKDGNQNLYYFWNDEFIMEDEYSHYLDTYFGGERIDPQGKRYRKEDEAYTYEQLLQYLSGMEVIRNVEEQHQEIYGSIGEVLSYGTDQGNPVGDWVSSDKKYVFHIDNGGTSDSRFVDINGRNGSTQLQVSINGYTVELTPYEYGYDYETYSFVPQGHQLTSGDIILNRVPDIYMLQFLGSWESDGIRYTFNKDGKYSSSKDSDDWGRYFVLSDHEIAMGTRDQDFKIKEYRIENGRLIMDNGKTLDHTGEYENSLEKLSSLYDTVCGTWLDDFTGRTAYQFYDDGLYIVYDIQKMGNSAILGADERSSGNYIIYDENTIYVYQQSSVPLVGRYDAETGILNTGNNTVYKIY